MTLSTVQSLAVTVLAFTVCLPESGTTHVNTSGILREDLWNLGPLDSGTSHVNTSSRRGTVPVHTRAVHGAPRSIALGSLPHAQAAARSVTLKGEGLACALAMWLAFQHERRCTVGA